MTSTSPPSTSDLEPDYGCCVLDDRQGSGHDGPCAFVCDHCQGSGSCPACAGTGDDGSGLDYTCTECGGGSCPHCDEGLVQHDH